MKTRMPRRGHLLLVALLSIGVASWARAAGPKCGAIGLVNRVFAATGPSSLRTKAERGLVRTWKVFELGGAPAKRAYENVANRILAQEADGLVDFDLSVGKLVELADNANVTDAQRGVVYVAMEYYAETRGSTLPFPSQNSSSWLSKAGAGNRGEIIELVLAMNAEIHGITLLPSGTVLRVQHGNVAGLGERVATALGDVEGDVSELVPGIGKRFVDVKGIFGSLGLLNLDKVEQALLLGGVQEFVYAVEPGVTFPSTWVQKVALINQDLIAANKRPILFGSVPGF